MTTTTSRWCIATFVALAAIAACDAAVHPYAGEYFEPHADAYVFRAGREGLFAQVDDATRRRRRAPRRASTASRTCDSIACANPPPPSPRASTRAARKPASSRRCSSSSTITIAWASSTPPGTRVSAAPRTSWVHRMRPGRLIVTPRDDDPESPWVKAVPFSGDDVDARV